MYLESNIFISFALLSVQAFQIYVTNTENAPSNATCEEDGMSLYPCDRLADTAEKLQQCSFFSGIVNITFLPGDYIIHNSLNFQFHSLKKVYLKSWKNQGHVRIICDGGNFSLNYAKVYVIDISSLEFFHCGSSSETISIRRTFRVNIQSCNFTNSSEGFIEITGTARSFNICHCIFRGSSNNFGVSIRSTRTSNISILNSVFENNTFCSLRLYPHTSSGNVLVKIDRCQFAHNRAGSYSRGAGSYSRGAAIAVVGYARTNSDFNYILISRCSFRNNTAENGGAVIISDYHKINVYESEFTDNFASKSGGALKLEGTQLKQYSDVFMLNCTFTRNYAKYGGGLLLDLVTWSESTHLIANCKLYNNAVTEYGGAMMTTKKALNFKDYLPNNHAFHMKNVTWERNVANRGGALYFNNIKNITF